MDRDTLDRLAKLVPPARGSDSTKRTTGRGDNSRSAAAYRLGCTLRRTGKTFERWSRRCGPTRRRDWCRDKADVDGGRQYQRIWDKAGAGVTLTDFHAYMPMHAYIFIWTRALWPASSINARIPPIKVGVGKDDWIKASTWLDQNRPVEQMTWAPGLPEIIEDRLLYEGGWLDKSGVRCFNQYLAPAIIPGDARRADKWLNHVRLVYPNEAKHLVSWLAHRVSAHEKINRAPARRQPGHRQGHAARAGEARHRAVEFQEASPQQVLGRFNGYLKAVILRISEAISVSSTTSNSTII